MAVRKLKFKECIECANQRTAICIRCGAGEFFEVKGAEEMTDEDLFDALKDYDNDY